MLERVIHIDLGRDVEAERAAADEYLEMPTFWVELGEDCVSFVHSQFSNAKRQPRKIRAADEEIIYHIGIAIVKLMCPFVTCGGGGSPALSADMLR